MLLVIFGAGASYDSVQQCPLPRVGGGAQNNWTPVVLDSVKPYEEFRPPLANQLFDNRPSFVQAMQDFADCKPLVPLLRSGSPVEQQLAKFEEQAQTYPERKRQLAAIRYYLQAVLWECQKLWHTQHKGITNYATFLDAIERWRFETNEKVCFVTFNYDTMLEEAMEQTLRFRFDHFGRYITDEKYKLIKLHGSIDWGHEVLLPVKPRTSMDVLNGIAELVISERYRKVSRPHAVFDDNTVGFPALAIPVEKKSEFACPPEHLTALANAITNVTKIITVGWRATEQHFLKMLKSPLTGLQGKVDLMVVSVRHRGSNRDE